MKLLPIRLDLWLGDWRLLGLVILDKNDEEESNFVQNSQPFGFQLASEDVIDEVEVNLAREEDENAPSEADGH